MFQFLCTAQAAPWINCHSLPTPPWSGHTYTFRHTCQLQCLHNLNTLPLNMSDTVHSQLTHLLVSHKQVMVMQHVSIRFLSLLSRYSHSGVDKWPILVQVDCSYKMAMSTRDKCLSNIPVTGTWFKIAATNYNFQDHGSTNKMTLNAFLWKEK